MGRSGYYYMNTGMGKAVMFQLLVVSKLIIVFLEVEHARGVLYSMSSLDLQVQTS